MRFTARRWTQPLVIMAVAVVILTPAIATAGRRGLCGNPTLVGTQGDDHLLGSGGADEIVGLGGDDVMEGFGGGDTFCGGRGNDTMLGGEDWDKFSGGPGNDVMRGQQQLGGLNYEYAARGVRVDLAAGIATGQGRDTFSVIDTIEGSPFADVLLGDSWVGGNQIWGFGGSDEIRGRSADDDLAGGKGNDVLIGGRGDGDVALGQHGNDRCRAEEEYACEH